MGDDAEKEYRSEQLSRALALMTAKLEDAATLAVEGQAPLADEALHSLAQQIADLAGEAATVANAMAALLSAGFYQKPTVNSGGPAKRLG